MKINDRKNLYKVGRYCILSFTMKYLHFATGNKEIKLRKKKKKEKLNFARFVFSPFGDEFDHLNKRKQAYLY